VKQNPKRLQPHDSLSFRRSATHLVEKSVSRFELVVAPAAWMTDKNGLIEDDVPNWYARRLRSPSADAFGNGGCEQVAFRDALDAARIV